ncbi:hypothetical protein Tco_1114022 [Tanacetum coccineum]|uniref:Uncharacterized protein n=1 Tax=Tanacetum coccineum TaxID=301880 RepID=A0ABQ5ITZ9_9ASTR
MVSHTNRGYQIEAFIERVPWITKDDIASPSLKTYVSLMDSGAQNDVFHLQTPIFIIKALYMFQWLVSLNWIPSGKPPELCHETVMCSQFPVHQSLHTVSASLSACLSLQWNTMIQLVCTSSSFSFDASSPLTCFGFPAFLCIVANPCS